MSNKFIADFGFQFFVFCPWKERFDPISLIWVSVHMSCQGEESRNLKMKKIYQNYLRNLTAKLASCPKKPFKCPALCCFHTIKVPPRAEQSEKNNDFEKPPSQKCSTMASKLDFYILRNSTFIPSFIFCWHMICLRMHKIYMCGRENINILLIPDFFFGHPLSPDAAFYLLQIQNRKNIWHDPIFPIPSDFYISCPAAWYLVVKMRAFRSPQGAELLMGRKL